MYRLFHTDIHGKHLARSFTDLETAKELLVRKPFDIILMDEDEDFPGAFDLISAKGHTFTLEPFGFEFNE